MKISKNSLWYRLAGLYGGKIDNMSHWKEWNTSNSDFCGFSRRILWGTFKIIMFVWITAILSYGLLFDWIISIIAGIGPFGGNTEGKGLIMLCFILMIVSMIFCLFKLTDYNERKRWEKLNNNEPEEHGLIMTWYYSIKDKFCPIIEYKD